jgi:hypothetical protein
MKVKAEYEKYLAKLAEVNSQCKPCTWKAAQEIQAWGDFDAIVTSILNDVTITEPSAEAAACEYYLRTCK